MRKSEAYFKLLARDILDSYFKNRNVEAEIFLVSPSKIRALNRTFRGLDRPTNVLSFAAPSGFPRIPGVPKSLGEVYLCPSVIRSREESAEHLLIHGLLHLLGFDHDKERARIRMEKLEKQILAWLKNRS